MINFRSIFLRPFSILWETSYRIRRAFFEYGVLPRNVFEVPIISVGNLTFGGTGKTPFVIYLTKFFENRGIVPMVLSRGYKGQLEHGSGIIFGGQKFKANPAQYGDEPLLIAKHLRKGAIVIGSKRSENLKKYFSQVQPDIVVLDDGFQHLKLHRSCNLVLFDATMPIESLEVAPLGYLREGLTALRDADIVVINKSDLVPSKKIDALYNKIATYLSNNVPIFKVRYVPTGLFNSKGELVMPIEELDGQDVIAVAALASPHSFFKMLEDANVKLVDTIVYPDHHYFSGEDVNQILFRAGQTSSIVVTTEKDIVKLRRIVQHDNILYLGIELEFLEGELDFQTAIVKSLSIDSDGFIDFE
jgi:tetraacyldisaccharide 4'-kinase